MVTMAIALLAATLGLAAPCRAKGIAKTVR